MRRAVLFVGERRGGETWVLAGSGLDGKVARGGNSVVMCGDGATVIREFRV